MSLGEDVHPRDKDVLAQGRMRLNTGPQLDTGSQLNIGPLIDIGPQLNTGPRRDTSLGEDVRFFRRVHPWDEVVLA